MNRHHHRLVFNAARGCLMAVAETARCAVKAASGSRAGRRLVLAAAAGPGLWLLAMVGVQAQIVADPTAPGQQRPTVLSAPNGVPLVNIQTPSAAGVSRNVYRQFDVQGNGANRQLHPSEIQWIKNNAKRYAEKEKISVDEAEKRLAQQAFRQVQFGVDGVTDASAQAFLKEAGIQLLPGDGNAPGQNVGYMFYATPAQKVNPAMYAQALVNDPQALAFYAKQGLVQPSTANLLAAAQKDSAIRDAMGKGTLGAAALAVGVTLPPAASWCLTNPVACNSALVTGAEIAAGDALGPMGLAIGGVSAAKAGLKGMKSAEEVNAVMRAAGDDPAWALGTAVISAEIKPGTRVQMVVTEEQYLAFMKPLPPGQSAKLPIGNWATFDDVATQVQARQGLAIKPEYKQDVKYVFEYEIVKPINANIGLVGEQVGNSGALFRGGGTQVEFDWVGVSNRSEYLRPIGQPRILPSLVSTKGR